MKLLEELIYQALFLILNALINSSKVSPQSAIQLELIHLEKIQYTKFDESISLSNWSIFESIYMKTLSSEHRQLDETRNPKAGSTARHGETPHRKAPS